MPYSTANGIKIYYEVSGAGLPFVMVHANPFDHNLWMYQIAHFSTYFKVIAIDIRGYGRSDKPTTPFSLEEMADDVLGVCRDQEVKEAILGGVSVGSGMALLLGLDHPEMFKALILVGGNSGGAGSIEARIHGYTKIGIETYHIQHLKELVAPDFPGTKLGKISSRHICRKRSLAQRRIHRADFSRPRRDRHDLSARIDESPHIGYQRRIRQLACRRQENGFVDSRSRPQDTAQDRARLLYRRSGRFLTSWSWNS